jgi:sugar phosphate isomerase/epimerase
LGVPAIRIDVVPAKLARSEFLKLAADALAKIIADTEPTGVAFAIENHGTTTNDPAFLSALFEKVGSQRLGLTLDTANFYWFGHAGQLRQLNCGQIA